MIKMLSKRTSRGAVHPHAGTADGRGPHRLGHPDAADLAARLRDLALRSYRAVHETRDVAGEPSGMLDELRSSLLDLEAAIQDQNLTGLAPYVKALRRQVEARLG